MEVSRNRKCKGKNAGVSVGRAATSAAPTTQSASISPTGKLEKILATRAKFLQISITRCDSASAPLPSSPHNVPTTPSCLDVTCSPSSGSTLGAAASTEKKKRVDLVTNATISSSCSGTSSNLIAIPSTSSSAENVVPEASGSSGVTAPCHSLSSSSVPGGSTDLETPAPLTIPGSSGTGLPPQPPNWETRYIATYNSSSIYKTFPVDRGSSEFQTIAGLVSPYRVTTVEQIINPELWQSFAEKRKAMLRSKSDDLNLLKGLGFSSSEVARTAKFSEQFVKHRRLKTKYGEYSANEALLLHCTKDFANLENIMVQGLDERVGGNGRLGRGLYFSDDPDKCVQYDGTGGTILVFGVLLGDCLSVDAFSHVSSLVREPEKKAKQKRNKNDHFFDSITARGLTGLGYNEYVIFNRHQCYPFYIVRYQRGFREYPEGTRGLFASMRRHFPIIAWHQLVGEGVSMPSYFGGKTWSFYAASIFKAMESEDSFLQKDNDDPAASTSEKLKQSDTTGDLTQPNVNLGTPCGTFKRRRVADEECLICTNKFAAFCKRPSILWEQLKCNHRICNNCYKTIEVSRRTMSGMPCTSARCPFCRGISGIEVGDCPDGMMTVSYVNAACWGYEGNNSIVIRYVIDSGNHKLDRMAFLPNSQEGKEILKLLITAWDRRLTFRIGTSMTTGEQNVLVWNIHHKTKPIGGVARYGYPDEGYFSRVRAELTAYGIE